MTLLPSLETHFNAREPSVLAFVPEEGRFDRLRREAKALLKRYPDPEKRPPLFGVPIGVKDIFHVDGFITRAGSRVPPAAIQGAEAESVTRLRNAGALILGKTVTTEFAYFAPGPTRNPHNPAHTPGGSSSGSAAAVGAGLCSLAFGTQTIGSITRPAAFCGVVGYKPSYDRISRAGVIPLSPSVDHVGLFASDLDTLHQAASLLLNTQYPIPNPHKAESNRVSASKFLPKKQRINWLGPNTQLPTLGIPEGPYLERADPEGLSHFRAVCQRLAEAGYEIKPVDTMPDFDEIYHAHNLIVAAEAARVHEKWFAAHAPLYHPKTTALIQRGQKITNSQLQITLESRAALRARLTALMDAHALDLWLSPPACGPAPKGLDSTGDPVMNLPWTHAGLPTLNLPAGKNNAGLPMGLQVTARWYADEQLFQWATELEVIGNS